MNLALRENQISRYYKTIVIGKLKENSIKEGYLTKDGELNKVRISDEKTEDAKKIITKIKTLDYNKDYSLLEIQLLTGRSHQIRAHLASIGHPIIGDTKYGNREVNNYFKNNFALNYQMLQAYKIKFNRLNKPLDYLGNREFIADSSELYKNIEDKIFN